MHLQVVVLDLQGRLFICKILGTYVYVYYGGRSLEVCGQNTYSLGQTQFCFDCPYGTYQDSVGQISCTDAPLGKGVVH